MPAINGKAKAHAKLPVAKPIGLAERKVIYPNLEVKKCWAKGVDGGIGPITYDQAGLMLGWETEAEFTARMRIKLPERPVEELTYGDDYLLVDEEGNKVRCGNNNVYGADGQLTITNREFKENHARKLQQNFLSAVWAGPTCMPGETINGETVIISKTGWVESAQHRLIGYRLAVQRWRKNPAMYPEWKTEPVFDALVVLGISESPRVVMTLDNVLPRSQADTVYTSDIFADLDHGGRKECSRMLAAAIDLLWLRTGAGEPTGKPKVWQTHQTSNEFYRRHEKKLLAAVKHLYEENGGKADKGRQISVLRISAGQAAAMCFLMGSCESNPDTYRVAEPPTEKELNWDRWEEAKSFWAGIGSKKDQKFAKVRLALASLATPGQGLGGRSIEKHAILAKAWKMYAAGEPMVFDDPPLEYGKDQHGNTILLERPTFGGIDLGDASRQADENGGASKEDVEAWKKKERERLAQDLKNRIANADTPEKEKAARAALEANTKAERERKIKERQEQLKAAAKDKTYRGGSGQRVETGKATTVAKPGSKNGLPPAPKILKTPLHKAGTEKVVGNGPGKPGTVLKRNAVQLKAREEARKADEELTKKGKK